MSPTESLLYQGLLWGGFLVAALVFISLYRVTAPYGRHVRSGWGPRLNSTLGWVLMELPAVLTILACFLWGNGFAGTPAWIFVAFWQIHYIHRTFIFPFRLARPGRKTPVVIVLFALIFNVFNGYMNGRYLGVMGDAYPLEWFYDPRFVLGSALFFFGMAINLHADHVLFRLRRSGGGEYAIPRGGLYRWISCPNYFGELVEWCGWAILTWSLPGLLFAVWTAANLVPRAWANHRWYHATFPDYPPERKAVLPLLY